MKAVIWIGLIWLALVVGARLAHCSSPVGLSDFDIRLMKFNDAWCKYYRKHFNCPVDATHFSDCNPNPNTVDYSGFVHVAHEGMKLFAPVEGK